MVSHEGELSQSYERGGRSQKWSHKRGTSLLYNFTPGSQYRTCTAESAESFFAETLFVHIAKVQSKIEKAVDYKD